MILIRALEWIGRNARLILLAGLVIVPLLPGTQGTLNLLLPVLVTLLIALAVARVDLREILCVMATPRLAFPIFMALLLFQPVTGLGLQSLGHLFGLGPALLLVLAAFAAAPPLTSAPNLALVLGYDARLALLITLTATLFSPLLVPVTLWLAGSSLPIAPQHIALKVFAMLLGGLTLGPLIRHVTGPARIARNSRAFDGLGAVVMLVFLFPLLDGVRAHVLADPLNALGLGLLALGLNIGGNLVLRQGLGPVLHRASAQTSGLLFGNRNLSILLAALPHDPGFSLFVALYQIPIYTTPLVLSVLDRRATPCLPSSES